MPCLRRPRSTDTLLAMTSKTRPKRLEGAAPIAVIFAACLWGTTGTAQALAPASAGPIAVGTLRIVLGGAVLLVFSALRNRLPQLGSQRAAWTIAILGMAAYQPAFFWGVHMAGVAIGTMTALGSAPIWAGILGLAADRDSLDRKWIAATIVALIGTALLVVKTNEGSASPVGILLSLLAGLSYASFAVASKPLLQKGHPEGVMAGIFTGAGVLLSPLLLFEDLTWLAEPRGFISIAHLGANATALAYLCFGWGLARMPTRYAVTMTLAEPATAVLLATMLLQEDLGTRGISGIALIALALALLTLAPSQRTSSAT